MDRSSLHLRCFFSPFSILFRPRNRLPLLPITSRSFGVVSLSSSLISMSAHECTPMSRNRSLDSFPTALPCCPPSLERINRRSFTLANRTDRETFRELSSFYPPLFFDTTNPDSFNIRLPSNICRRIGGCRYWLNLLVIRDVWRVPISFDSGCPRDKK